MKLEPRNGFSVAIRRVDGTEFLSNGTGLLPVVRYRRSEAVADKRKLIEHGFKCRVVPVLYAQPVIRS